MMNMRRHDIASQWCRFPRGKCTCSRQKIEYTRLQERLEEGWGEASYSDEERELPSDREELEFYNDDASFHSVVVETNLCANDLCQLLAMKNRVPKSVHWSIVEYWTDLGLERLLEDHEYVLSAYRDMRRFSYHTQFKFVFRKDYRKYEFFQDPLQFFPSGMLDVENESDGNMNPSYLQNLISQEGQCPIIFSYVWVRDEQKKTWSKTYMILRDKKLFTSQKVSSLAKFFRSSKNKAIAMISEDKELGNDVRVFAKLSNYHVYTTLNAKNQFRAPTEWGICLRPSGDNTDDETSSDQLCCLACDSERVRTCWITAMRLAKYGKQLRENYRAFRNKQAETINPKDYNSYSVPNVQLIRSKPLNGPMFKLGTYESVRSRVAMDFTGAVGRIVEDPQEANAIAIAEGYSWKRRWRPSTRLSGPSAAAQASAHIQTLEAGVHITQPWFHSGMTRDQATALITRYGTCDGVFLVRESRSNPGSFVLTYKSGSKVVHAQISPILDPLGDRPVYSLDSGVTKFYDILQLIEFYQLNAGCLPTRLTHYLVQNGNTVVVPTAVVTTQRAEQDQQAHTSSSRSSPAGGGNN